MENLTLDGILDQLNAGIEKSASEQESDKSKDEEAKKAKEKAKAEQGGKDGKSKDSKDKEEQEKSAAFKSGSDLAKEIMEKVASLQIKDDKGSEMNKQASEAGKALADSLLEKLAGLNDQNTTNGIVPGFVPNKSQVDLAAQKAEHDKSFQATPGTDGAGNGGTINQIFDAMVADAQARGVVAYGGQTSSASAEGAQNSQAPNQVQVDESHEKMAAAISLVNSGVDFDSAVELVKQASEEIEAEQAAFTKYAAFEELVGQGVDVNLAAAMVKEAGVGQALGSAYGAAHAYGKAGLEMVKATGSNMARKGRILKREMKDDFKVLRNPNYHAGGQVGDAAKRLGGRVAIGAAGVGAAGGAVAALRSREKKAALDELMEQGFDFHEAIAAINDAM